MGRLLQWSIRRADALIAVSDFVGRTLVAAGGHSERVHVVKNAIDPSRWIPDSNRITTRDGLGIEPSNVVLLTVCRLFPEKGPGLLINAFALARREEPQMRLLIVGQEMTPGYAEELADLASRLEVDDAVEFLGRREDVSSLMAAADIYAMPSFEEPFGLVFAEAMAMQLPVVALDSGGTPEVVEDGATGLLSQPNDTEALARNLLALVTRSCATTTYGSGWQKPRRREVHHRSHGARRCWCLLAIVTSAEPLTLAPWRPRSRHARGRLGADSGDRRHRTGWYPARSRCLTNPLMPSSTASAMCPIRVLSLPAVDPVDDASAAPSCLRGGLTKGLLQPIAPHPSARRALGNDRRSTQTPHRRQQTPRRFQRIATRERRGHRRSPGAPLGTRASNVRRDAA